MERKKIFQKYNKGWMKYFVFAENCAVNFECGFVFPQCQNIPTVGWEGLTLLDTENLWFAE